MDEENRTRGGVAGCTRKAFFRSASWTDRSPSKPHHIRNLVPNSNKARSCLPPLQPLSISRREVEEWPRPGSDDLGVWPNPETPREIVNNKSSHNSECEQPVREFQFKKDKLAFFDKECSKILDHVYLGSDSVAKNRQVLRQNRITHVLNCVGFVCPEYFKGEFVYRTLWLQDNPSEDITSILYNVFDYFEDVREQGGRVFVHCCQGISRSTSLVIAYLMWKEGWSFQDAFQYVKAARGVANPNLGFAIQLLQCQKRVHAVPASPNSILRMYRMAPHSSYDPLHLVPKMLNTPSVQGLDSRGAFVVHIPSAIYVWKGEKCDAVMLNMAKAAASQVVRYERAKGPILSIEDGDEPLEFWDALMSSQHLADSSEEGKGFLKVGDWKVEEYNPDFEIFHRAISGGVFPPSDRSHTESETYLPARENGWDTTRISETAKDVVTSLSANIDDAEEAPVSSIDLASPPLSPTVYLCGSPESFACFPDSNLDLEIENSNKEESSIPDDRLSLPIHPLGSPDSISSFQGGTISPKFGTKSPSLSPSTSDNSSSFTLSPSSSNWSDLSYMSSRQPSPSDMDPLHLAVRNSSIIDSFCLHHKETHPTFVESFSSYHPTLKVGNTSLTSRIASPSIAERRGSHPPSRMLLPSIEETCKVQRKIVRSLSFSLPDLDVDPLEISGHRQSENKSSSKDISFDIDRFGASTALECKFEEAKAPVFYQWPSMSKAGINQLGNLNS
ncbi:protein-tyrosine-phosphatase MKP1-like [Cucurbita moschata]|uniref:Protein-tyrosine-phosphatase MKP1-like n=1 Tax=Cucurbita moschata TaxID=3662 RepID=A0A6J1GYL0_CUCMO|nr:protein-tyrosine-phosphatase MKP1-like [Cucurbita moschata]